MATEKSFIVLYYYSSIYFSQLLNYNLLNGKSKEIHDFQRFEIHNHKILGEQAINTSLDRVLK